MPNVVDGKSQRPDKFVPVEQIGRPNGTLALPDSQLIHALNQDAEKARLSIYLIPFLSDNGLDAYVERMADRELEVFFARCFALAVLQRRGELGVKFV
jgi:hypothetical protein